MAAIDPVRMIVPPSFMCGRPFSTVKNMPFTFA
jgi:hypothetical protein